MPALAIPSLLGGLLTFWGVLVCTCHKPHIVKAVRLAAGDRVVLSDNDGYDVWCQ